MTVAKKPVPGVSPAAMQAGSHAAKNILGQMKAKTRRLELFRQGSWPPSAQRRRRRDRPFNSAACSPGTWVFVHLMFLIGFRNRSAVFLQWIWAYFTYGKGARLISGPIGKHGVLPE